MSIDPIDEMIERALDAREVPSPPESFTTGVMMRIAREQWQAERVVDFGFNLAIAAGVLFIAAGAAGLAWSLGFLTFTVDLDLVRDYFTRTQMNTSVISQLQTVATAAVILTITLVAWWWAEADSSSLGTGGD
jgi:hypothetical protein